MKILHTADIHFGEKSNHDLAVPCEEILRIATDEQPDLIVIAGDLTTERGRIDNETAVVCRTFVRKLAAIAPVWICAGNHDLTFREDVPDNIHAILADDFGSVIDGVTIFDSPRVVPFMDAAFAVIPYPLAASFHARTGETDLQALSHRLADLARGLAAQALQHEGMAPVLIYHGNLEGGRMGDESAPALKTRGQDIVLPINALTGFKAGLCGHLHHPQRLMLPDGIAEYPGCVAPLTFGEKAIEPGVLLWEVAGGEVVSITREPLPVRHQRIEIVVSQEDWDEDCDAALNLVEWIDALKRSTYGGIRGARVKVKATLPGERLKLFTPETLESVRLDYELHELKMDKTELETEDLVLQEGADRAARVDVVEALATYGESTMDLAFLKHLDAIQDIGRQVEEEIGSESIDPRYEFDPVRLEVTNYKTIGHAVIEFDKLAPRTGIFGPTGIGKTNLILAIAAALFGGNPKSEIGKAKTSMAEMVRRGENVCKLVLEFRSQGGFYRIVREIRVSAKGTASGKLFLDSSSDGGAAWEPFGGNKASETQEVIGSLVGPADLHWLTRHLRQHGTSAVKMGSTELADAINSTLQLDFAARAQKAKAIEAAAENARDAAEIRAKTLRETLPLPGWADGQIKRLTETITTAEADGQAAQDTLRAEEELLDAAKQRLTQAETRLGAVAPLSAERDEKAAALQQEEQRRDAMAAELGEDGDQPDLESVEADVARLEGERDRAESSLAEVNAKHHVLELEERDALEALRGSAQAAGQERAAATSRVTSARARVEDIARRAALTDRVPCEGETWTRPGAQAGTNMGTCPLLSDAIAAKGDLQSATSALQTAEERLEAAIADETAAGRQVERFSEEVAAAAGERKTARDRLVEGLRQVESDLRASKTFLDQWRRKLTRTAELRTQHQLSAQRVEMLQEQVAALEAKLGEADQLRLQVDQEREIVRLGLGRVSEARHRVGALQEALTQAEIELAGAREAAESAKRVEAECNQLDKTALASERKRMAAAFYGEAVQRQGIPSLLLRQLAPQLQARINDILAPAGRQIRIETERDLTTGKTKTEVNLHFSSPTSGGEWVPIAELSGGEEDLANAAWAIGLARVAADMTATPLGLVVLDEPFTGVSAEHEEATREILGHIQQHVSRVMIITHKRDLMPMVDAALVLSQNGAGTVVEVAA